MLDINTMLILTNIGLSAVNVGCIIAIYKFKLKLQKETRLVEEVGPIPQPQPLQPVPVETPLQPLPTIEQQVNTPKVPEEIKGSEPTKKISAKAQKQIDLLQKEIERISNL